MSPSVKHGPDTAISLYFLALCIAHGASAFSIAYTALGDSYAAGIGSSPSTGSGPACYQTDKSYVAQLGKFDNVSIDATKFQDRACAGLTLDEMAQCAILGNVTADPDDLFTCGTLPPSPGIGAPDLVTIHMGAESIQYYDLIQNCVYFPFVGGCRAVNETTESAFVDLASPLGPNFTNFLTGNLTAPTNLTASKVKLINYPLPFNTDDGSDASCPAFAGNHVALADRRIINNVVQQLNNFLQNQSLPTGVDYLDVNPLFNGHRFCDKDPTAVWLLNPLTDLDPATKALLKTGDDVVARYGAITEYPPSPNPDDPSPSGAAYLFGAFHPTADGHQAIAKLVSQNM